MISHLYLKGLSTVTVFVSLFVLILIGFIFGACIGSFLTVVVSRLPKMLVREWKNDCAELTGSAVEKAPRFDLALPRSHCTHCKKNLRVWHNIPILSFLLLGGRCAFCKHAIGCQCAAIEWVTAIFTAACLGHYGLHWELLAPLVTLYFFIPLAFIDYNEQLLPDQLTLGLLWLGLLWSLTASPSTAIIGAAAGYAVPWFINRLFIWIRKKPGMGHGDFKCLAAIGAWAGLTGAMGCYVLAAILSLAVTIPLFINKKTTLDSALPFGPFLCIAGWVWVVFGTQINLILLQAIFP